jgi:hypothetical protein
MKEFAPVDNWSIVEQRLAFRRFFPKSRITTLGNSAGWGSHPEILNPVSLMTQ